jgi:hypothetical protein
MKNSKSISITQTEALIVLASLSGKTKEEIMVERGIVESTWFNHIGSIREKLTGGWKDSTTPEIPTMVDQIKAEILFLVQEGRNPLIQEDVISSRSLMLEIRKRNKCYPCDAQIAQGLKSYGMESAGRMLIVGERHYLWAQPGIDRNHAVARVQTRMMNWGRKS